MNYFYLYLFLLTKESGTRLLPILVEKGYHIGPSFSEDRSFLQGKYSTVLGIRLSHSNEEKTALSVTKEIKEILEKLNIPYHGYHLREDSTGKSMTGSGLYSFAKEKAKATKKNPSPKSIPVGPYHDGGIVIPFPPPKK